MRQGVVILSVAAVRRAFSGPPSMVLAGNDNGGKSQRDERGKDDKQRKDSKDGRQARNVQGGPRPYYLVEDLDPEELKTELQKCSEKPLKKTDFSIGHRGAPLQFPEHTKESYEAAARMGAGIVECDVTFTKDKELVCRHSQCDLHTTTNILATLLAGKCSVPFVPANPAIRTLAQALCSPRVVPYHPQAMVPLKAAQILWR